ncbi:PREDICTED: uncharacterized protein LOC102245440 [Myotis brandtii]|uniref:uncharacterized protein LOC102245440 n=1 Tax=Myotis brandtii TaxID=109478 RepID=UPI00070458AF|nr:PREDICTED: uncharacterized protein LOC102245440 [Myotis brandtii]
MLSFHGKYARVTRVTGNLIWKSEIHLMRRIQPPDGEILRNFNELSRVVQEIDEQDFQRRAGGYGYDVNDFDLQRFCEREWPAFQVGWPDVGSVDLTTAYRVHHVIYGRPGHPDQIPYIQVWVDILAEKPRWLKTCLSQQKQLGQRQTVLLATPGKGEVQPVLQSNQEESSPQAGPSALGPDGQPFMVYVPFPTRDLYNWKNQNPSFSQNPQGLISLLESVFLTHQPTWADCQLLLQTLFTSEERERIRAEGRKLVLGPDGQPSTDPGRVETLFPAGRPQWDPNSGGREALDRYRQTLLRGIRAAARKPTNLSKVTETVQGPNESPAAFLERLCEAYRVYTPIDPEAPENRRAINVAFVSQSAPDIRRKLQKLEGFEGKSVSELVEVAQRVFHNREDLTAGLNTKMNRCAYCKKEGHWKRECPEKPGARAAPVLGEEADWGRQGSTGPREPPVGGQKVDLLVDTGATFSVLRCPVGPVSGVRTPIQGAAGRVKSYPWTRGQITDLGAGSVTHSFLVMPECPYPLLGRDLLNKLRATISFDEGKGPKVHLQAPEGEGIFLLTLPLQEEYRLHEEIPKVPPENHFLQELRKAIPGVWAEENPPGLAKHRPPIIVQLTSSATPVRVRQYPISQKARVGIAKHIKRLKEAGILVPCQSAWNTPLLPVQKPGTEDFRPVQDLREVNKRVETIHPAVPNPYTLLSLLKPTHQYYSVLDLKDAVFSLPLARQSQPIFAFKWMDPEEGESGQLTWTRLPQGFKNSSTLFHEALNQDLWDFHQDHTGITLLQYVDDLLLATENEEDCIQATQDLLRTLDHLGYRVSAKKAQLCTTRVTYLGYNIEGGKRTLSHSRIQAILSIPTPKTKRQVREFLGAVGYCRLWILGFAEIAKPLYAATGGKGPDLRWTEEEEGAYQKLKQALVSAPALALPDLAKPFQLFVAESRGVAKGVLMQTLGPRKQPVAYLSKRLDPVASGWPNYLRAIAATTLLVKEASKLTFEQDLQVVVPHAVESLLRSPPERWLSNARITQYQVLLLNPPRVSFLKTAALNPATLLPDEGAEPPLHNCEDTLTALTSLQADITDQPLDSPEETVYTDGSSYVENGIRYTGAAVVTQDRIIWAQALGQGTSAQKAELIALTQALRWGKNKKINVYTESRYAFATVHVHGALYQEWGLLTSGGKDIKNVPEILNLLAAVWGPQEVAVIHCRGHQKDDSPVAQGNQFADQTAKEVAKRPVGPLEVLLAIPPRELPQKPTYNPEEKHLAERLRAKDAPSGWLVLPDGRPLVPEVLGRTITMQTHQSTHLGGTKLAELLKGEYYIPGLHKISKDIAKRCHICAQVNPGPPVAAPPGHRFRGLSPGEHWEVDFSELPMGQGGYRYLLVFMDTFSGWPEAYPTRTETAQVVVKKLLSEIVPRFGLPLYIGSDNGPAFIAKVNQTLVKALRVTWKLHCIYRPQSSGQVKRMNRTLQETLTKLKLETGENWVSLLPFALLRARCTPYIKGLTPYEIMFGRPPPLLPCLREEELAQLSTHNLLKSLQALQNCSTSVHRLVQAVHKEDQKQSPMAHPIYVPGDLVWVKRHDPGSLEPRWDGPFQVILSTPTAVKVAGKRHWIHRTQKG